MKLITSICGGRGIGYNTIIPWLFKKELELFHKLTIGNGNNAVIAGRKTILNIPTLKNRKEIILSNNFKPINTNQLVINNISQIPKDKFDDIWIIGGKSTFEYFLNTRKIKEIHLLQNKQNFMCNYYLSKLPPAFHEVVCAKYTEKNIDIFHKIFKLQF